MNRTPVLFLNVLVIATCGLVYELLAGTLASYVLGDSVTQFSLVIGLYLFGAGRRRVALAVRRERAGAALRRGRAGAWPCSAGLSAPLLFLDASRTSSYFHVVLYGVVFLIGTLVGLEIPLLMRILKDQLEFKELVSRVLTFDYIGALVASLLFPLFLVPQLGLVRTSLALRHPQRGRRPVGDVAAAPAHRGRASSRPARARPCIVMALLAVGVIKADRADLARRGRAVRRRHRLREDDALPAHRRHARPRGLPALPERQPAVQLGRRVPLPRGARPPGDGARRRAGTRRAACSSSAAATASRCARS